MIPALRRDYKEARDENQRNLGLLMDEAQRAKQAEDELARLREQR